MNSKNTSTSKKLHAENSHMIMGIIDSLELCICRWAPDSTLTFTNKAHDNIFAWCGQIVGQKWIEHQPESLKPSLKIYLEEITSTPREMKYEEMVVAEDGQTLYYEWHDKPLFDRDGNLYEFLSVGFDITMRKQGEGLIAAQRDLAHLLSISRSDEATWEACLQIAMQVSRLDCGGIYTFDKDQHCFEMIYSVGIKDEFARAVRVVQEDQPEASIIISGNAVLFKESEMQRLYQLQEGIRSLILLPIQYQKQIIGCMVMGSHSLAAITEGMYQTLTRITPEIANLIAYRQTETRRKIAEAELQETSDRLLEAQEVAKMGSWEYSTVSGIFNVSEQAAQILEIAPQTIRKDIKELFASVHPKDFALVIARHEDLFTKQRSIELEYTVVLPTGSHRHVQERTRLILDAQGGLVRVIAILQDISEARHAAEERQEHDSRYRLLYETMLQGVVFQNADGRITHANPAAEQILGFPLAVMQGKTLAALHSQVKKEDGSIFSPEEHPAAVSLRRGIPITNITMGIQHPATQEERWVHLNAIPRFREGEPHPFQVFITFEEITMRRNADKELREANDRFNQIVSNISEIFWIDDLIENKTIYVSPAFEAILGIKYQDLGPSGIAEIIHPEDRQKLHNEQRMERSAQTTEMQYRFIHIDGSVRWMRIKTNPVFDSQGRHVRVVGIARDVTEQQKALQLLTESEARLRQITETIEEVFWMFDHTINKLIYISPAYEKVWQRSVASLYNNPQDYLEAIVPEDRALMLAAMQDQKNGLFTSFEYRIQQKDGKIRWLHDKSFPIVDSEKRFARTAGVAIDITERKLANLALQASEAKYRELSAELEERVFARTAEIQDLYDNAPVGYHSINIDGILTRINVTQAQWLGYQPSELIGRHISEIITATSMERFLEIYPIFLKSGHTRDVEIDFMRKDGSILPTLISATAIYDEQGHYVMSRTTIFDNTNKKEAEEVMRSANQEMARAMRLKDEFLASMSHELRTPLTGILGLSESLQLEVYGPIQEKQKKAISTIENSGRHLLDLINDILDVSKIEAGKFEMDITPCRLEMICQESMQLVRGMAAKKNQSLHINMPHKNIILYADALRIKQVFVNLLGNAVKFTPHGGHLGLDVSTDPQLQTVKITIWDEGIGISTDNLKKLFKPFIQLDSSLSREHSGTGLGLVLAQRLIEAHSGSIQVKSEPEKGSRFIITLPYQTEHAAQTTTLKKASSLSATELVETIHKKVVIMIVDDNEVNVETVADYLESHQFQTVKCLSGAECLKKISEIPPDLILMDIQMPGMDGLETMHHLRDFKDIRFSSVPIIAVTALAMPGDRETCIAAGANEYISKPFRLAELVSLIKTVLSSHVN